MPTKFPRVVEGHVPFPNAADLKRTKADCFVFASLATFLDAYTSLAVIRGDVRCAFETLGNVLGRDVRLSGRCVKSQL